MKPTLAILTIGVAPDREILSFLTGHIPAEQITHLSLLGHQPRDRIMAQYAAAAGEEQLLMLLGDGNLAWVGRDKVTTALQQKIALLDNQGYRVILLMSNASFTGLTTRQAALLEPQRIVPPLVASIVDGHQVGIMLPVAELIPMHQQNWLLLDTPPLYALANPLHDSEQDLLGAGQELLQRGADVLVLDYPGFHLQHRDLLQNRLDVPVLSANALLAKLTSELLS